MLAYLYDYQNDLLAIDVQMYHLENNEEKRINVLILIWVGFLGIRFEMGESKVTPSCLKIVRIMLETWNLVRKYTHICSFRKYTFCYKGPVNFADASIFLQK